MSDNEDTVREVGLRILSLDGDGVNVFAELTILKELMYRIQTTLNSSAMPLPCDWFQLIGGTGTGGLVAILLGRLRLSIDEAIRCYLTIMGRVFDKKRVNYNRERELETSLKGMLERYCNDAEAPMIDTYSGASTCKVVVYAMPAVAIQAGTPTCIRTYHVSENQGPECSIADAIRATTATPGILKRKAIFDGEVEVPYVGAGLGCNNPTALLLVEAGRAYPNQATACVFSAGAGQLHPIGLSESKRLLDSMSSQIAAAAEAVAKDCERVHQEVAVRFSHAEGLYFRFNPEHGMQDLEKSNSNRLSDVQAHAKAYLEDAATSGRLNAAKNAIITGKGTAMLLNGNIMLLVQNQLAIGRCPAPSAMFTGRDDLLELLRIYFFDQSHKRHLFVLYGLGGAGKTQLALAFVHRYKKMQVFWDIFYIDATTVDTIKAGLKRLAGKAKTGDMVDDALEWLASQESRWLIVYNNADDPAVDLSGYFPNCAHGDILITTRNRDMIVHTPDSASHYRVGDMKEGDARELLLKTSGIPKCSESEAAADNLVKHMGFLALAIVQAGAYIRLTECNMTDYLDIFLSSRDRLLRTPLVGQTDGYKLTAYATWDVSYRSPRLLPRAAQLLGVMSFMHHDGISADFFKTAATNLSQFEATMPLTKEEADMQQVAWDFLRSITTPKSTWDTICWQELTNNLRSFSLLDYDTTSQTYSMHPLVHSWCRSTVPNARTLRECAAWVLALCVNWEFGSQDYAFRRLLLPHAIVALETDEPITPPLAVNLNVIFEEAQHAKQVESLCAHAMKASKERLGSEHVNTLTRMYSLGLAYFDQGQWEEAEELLVKVVQVQNRVLGKDHPDVLSSTYELASIYGRRGRLMEAEALFIEVLEAERRVLGEEHPDVLFTIHELALTYTKQERWQEAEKLLAEVVEVRRRVLGDDHPNTLSSIYQLGSTCSKQGRYQEAEEHLMEVLEARRRVLGQNHPDVLSGAHELAYTYEEQGRLQEAAALLESMLGASRPKLGEEHPHVRCSTYTLASIYGKQERWGEAGTLLVELVAVTKRVLGAEHPNLIPILLLLGAVHWNQGRLSEAELLEVDALELAKRAMGLRHPTTLTAMHNLATTYMSQGKLLQAEQLMKKALELRKQVIGENHPNTQRSIERLAEIRIRLNESSDQESGIAVLDSSTRSPIN